MKQLQEDGEIAYFEKRGRSLLLYWTNVPAGFEKEVAIAFVGSVPGHFSGAASYVYEYYNKKNIRWIPGLSLDVLVRLCVCGKQLHFVSGYVMMWLLSMN